MCAWNRTYAHCAAKAQVTYSGGRTIVLHVEEIQILKFLDLFLGKSKFGILS